MIFDLTAGKTVATFDQAAEGDSAIYDARGESVLLRGIRLLPGGQLAIFSGGNPVTFVTNVPTTPEQPRSGV